ncbi:MAG: PDZ domain-containing protein, partial [Candidatus Saccharimonadales bacterium]
PAARAGIKEGDIITKVNDTELSETVSLVTLLAQYGPGDSVKLTIVHGKDVRTITVKLDKYQ